MSNQLELSRARDGRMLAGVCAGIARKYNLDVNLVRLGTVLLAVFAQVGWLIYVVAWAILPEESTGKTGFDQVKSLFSSGNQR